MEEVRSVTHYIKGQIRITKVRGRSSIWTVCVHSPMNGWSIEGLPVDLEHEVEELLSFSSTFESH